ncbi:MAG TPA: hypothetical protein VFQ68_10995 [Streptosporangiaceae bacterium]|nr:hypothetical protein [Streptosporangiaceae bacterium]
MSTRSTTRSWAANGAQYGLPIDGIAPGLVLVLSIIFVRPGQA